MRLSTFVCVFATLAGTGAAACDRSCLIGIADQYLAAMVKHDPAGLPLAPRARYTENTATIPLGDGLWVGVSEAPSTFKIYAAEPVSGQVGFFGVLKEFGKPVMLALRIKVENGRITEIEHVVARQLWGSGLANLVTPRPGLLETVPPPERVSRQEMLRIADSYFDSIEQTNGKRAPFADDCERHENGGQTTTRKTPDPAADHATQLINALGCAAQIDAGELRYITRIRPRRLLVIDEEKGLVYGFPMFVHRGAVRSVEIVGVPGVQSRPKAFGPINLLAGEIFKIRGGKIHEIEAMGVLVPYGAASGWE
ncbi:MAG: hypothetical protein ABSH47_08010 [Bryobacteraceae bacterium]|jgi:hypothetical protein